MLQQHMYKHVSSIKVLQGTKDKIKLSYMHKEIINLNYCINLKNKHLYNSDLLNNFIPTQILYYIYTHNQHD